MSGTDLFRSNSSRSGLPRSGEARRLGRYDLGTRIGVGGMGIVHRATGDDGGDAAIKTIRPEYADDPAFRRHLAREVALLRQLRSPYVPAVLDADLEAAQPWFAMEYVAGESLADSVAADGPLADEHAMDVAIELGAALDDIHTAGVVHRDIKPANILLGRLGPVLIDFGIAAAEAASCATVAHVAGSPAWMAPEQVTGDAPATAAADVFAAALTIAYALTGRSPYGEGAPHAFLYRVVHTDPDLSGVPDALRPALTAALAKDPGRRPTAAGLRQLLIAARRGAACSQQDQHVQKESRLAA